MKLYRNSQYVNRWFAYSDKTGWVMFPAEIDGWEKRQPARGFDPIHAREVSLSMALNTGIPGAPELAENAAAAARVELGVAA